MDVRSIRTIFAADLAVHKAIGKPYLPLPNSTLNQKYKVFEKEVPAQGEYPYIRYVAIGCKGARFGVTTDNRPIINQIPHSPKHASLYDGIPWLVRKADEDISPEQRRRYRMRVPFNKDGISYVAYYLMAMDVTVVTPTVELRHTKDGQTSSTTFNPSVDDLMAPEQIQIPNIELVNPDADCLVSTAKMTLSLNENDIAEIINAFTVIDGDPSKAIISEMAVVSGIDRQVSGVIGNTTGTYTECIAAQVNVFLHQFEVLSETRTGMNFVFDVGSSEMLLL